MSRILVVLTVLLTVILSPLQAQEDDDPDLIFKKTTVWKFLSPDHKLATYAIDDPLVEGVACHFTVPEKGGWSGWLGVAEELSDASLACRQIGPVKFTEKFDQGAEVYRERRSLFFKRCGSCAVATPNAMFWCISSIPTN